MRSSGAKQSERVASIPCGKAKLGCESGLPRAPVSLPEEQLRAGASTEIGAHPAPDEGRSSRPQEKRRVAVARASCFRKGPNIKILGRSVSNKSIK